jgi:UDP-2,4-diacetamido-2,4,6-trideoxy-beta-L-altropyranose hydrolase
LPSIGAGSNESDVHWTKKNWERDAKETSAIIKEMENGVDLIIVDHYGLGSCWESTLRGLTKYIMVIDDLADRPHDCDLLLDQNYYINADERYADLVANQCVQMLGPNYVLLREEFLQAANEPRVRTGEINNILVFFGGTDSTGETIKTLELIKKLGLHEIEFNVVIGGSNPKQYEIEQMCKGIQQTNFYCQVHNMAELMWKADLAIGAGGATTWERCLLGLPSLTIVLAENQREVTETLANKGATIYLGNNVELTKEYFQKAIIESIQNPVSMKKMSRNCAEIINVKMIEKYPVTNNIMELLK